MGETSYLQTNFQGGEWSQTYQGRMDDPHYRTALSVCLNAFPTETGAWTRRGGSRFLATTRGAVNGRVIKFDINETLPYVMEFTNSFLRFYGFNGNVVGLITTNDAQTVTGISTANPAVVTTALPHGWVTGNTVMLSGLGGTMAVLQNRQFLITVTGTNTFSLQDAITNTNINGSGFGSFMGGTVARVLELNTNYYGQGWQQIVPIQTETQSILVNGQLPQVVSLLTPPGPTSNATFSIAPSNFQDGPYLDPIANSYVNYDSFMGNINLTFFFQTWSSTVSYGIGAYVTDASNNNWISLIDNNIGNTPASSPTAWQAVYGAGFTDGDIGRHIRLFSEPTPWLAATTYAAGNVVSYPGSGAPDNTYWQSLVNSNVGVTPGTSVTNWALVTGATYAQWTWGKIISTKAMALTVSTTIGNMTNLADAFNGNRNQTAANSASATSGAVTTYPQWQDQTAYAISTNAYYNGFFYQTAVAFTLWNSYTAYSVGAVVEFYDGNYYKCLTANTNKSPPYAPSVWQSLGIGNPTNTTVWNPGAAAQSAIFDVFAGAHFTPAKAIQQATVYSATDLGFGAPSGSITFNLWGSNSAPASPQNGTLLGTATNVSQYGHVTIQSNSGATTWAYVWIEMVVNVAPPLPDGGSHSYTATGYVSQIRFYAPAVGLGNVEIELLGPDMLYSPGTPVFVWQAGLYSNAAGWPTCGCYYEGRLWLAGALPNRIDSSMSNNLFTFSPTGPDGTVADNNGISFTFNADGTNTIYWMEQDALGIVSGTDGGEWLVPNAAPPLTPSNISAARVTKQNCANIQPVRTEHTICAVQRMQRKMFEYFADIFSGKFTAPNITERARHLTAPLFEEIRYQQELTPTIWARMGDGSLIGCAYKRDTLMTSQGPTYYGWHRHQLGSGRQIVSLTVGPTDSGGFDSPIMVTFDPLTMLYHVELLTDYFEETDNYQQAFLLDDAVVPASYSVNNAQTQVTINGLWHLNGKTVQVFAAGLDCGLQDQIGTISDFTVSNGSVVVPFGDGIAAGSGAGLFTAAFVNSFAAGAMPIVVGFTYTSQGQLLRPVAPAEAGTRAGPAFGKKRRNHRFAVQAVQTNALSVGANFTELQPIAFRGLNGAVPILLPTLFSGVFQGEVRDDFSYDGQICWQVSRPVPALIAAIGAFIDTADV